MERNNNSNRLIDILFRKVGSSSTTLPAILLYSLVAGVASALVDADHILLIAYVWWFEKLPPSEQWWLCRPLHLLVFAIAIYLPWHYYPRSRRLHI